MSFQEHFDWVAENDSGPRNAQRSFHSKIQGILRYHIPEGSKVLEWGCGPGELLESLKPSRGLGVDLSPKMVERADRERPHSNLEFRKGDLHTDVVDEEFDAVILDYLPGYLQDIHASISNLKKSCHPRTRLYILSLNHVYRPLLALAKPL